MKSANQLWNAALGQLEVEIPRPNFETWLRGTTASRLEDGVLTVSTSSTFAAEMLEQRLYNTIERAVRRVSQSPLEVKFAMAVATATPFQPATLSAQSDSYAGADAPAPAILHKRGKAAFKDCFTFDDFVAGPPNQLAHAAAVQVAESPGDVYNPLYLYSQVGLGKTHLLNAIGHRLARKGVEALYVSAEQFTNEYIRAIREGTTDQFRDDYRSVDALLVDDIQFIAEKPQTQEGFFHTFNELHMKGKQIVVSCDRPTEKVKLEARIQSRLQGGLVADIQPATYELKYAILQHKAMRKGVTVPPAVLDMLAMVETDSVRELEGGLNRILAYAGLIGSPIDMRLAETALMSVGTRKPQTPPQPEAVVTAVSAHTGVPESSITGLRRDRRVSSARRMAAYLLREECRLSTKRVGEELGGKDHSTVIYAQRKFEQEMASDLALRRLVAEIRRALSTSG